MVDRGRRFKDEVYDQFARVGKALASPRRLELLDLLAQGPRSVEVLATHVDQPLANTSHHLRVLRAARLVDSEKVGTRVIYRVAGDDVITLFQAVRGVAESRLAEVELVTRQFLEERQAMERIDAADLLERTRSGVVTVLDVRPREEYEGGHVPGAVSVPLDELKSRLSELPMDRAVVAYCRGPYCVLAVEAIEILRAGGFEAVRMEDGVAEWAAHGFDIETEEATR
ncbi:MAG: hypothetical protein JJLCMIEE_03627 [Acidimicrobiales bacterium]|nr:MAG: ArsR family transcriptional regulator [Actinomycetota bacterium]MBV6510471.1 hypothetical protein [Acidimicrobiales bacterium]RIK02481.1 MAG: ArsR family transcriptional regulator [Acidobacteriota bacterium]